LWPRYLRLGSRWQWHRPVRPHRVATHLWPAARRACKLYPDRTFGHRLHLIPQPDTREGCTCRRSTSFRAAVWVCRPMRHAPAGPELAAARWCASRGNGATIHSQRYARSKQLRQLVRRDPPRATRALVFSSLRLMKYPRRKRPLIQRTFISRSL